MRVGVLASGSGTILRALLERGLPIAALVVDRNAHAVLANTDDAVVLEKGRVVLAGTSAELEADRDALLKTLGV